MTARVQAADCVVIGAGVVELAVARALALTGRDVLVLEACNAIGTQTSARNSEVIHAGIYYPAGTLKARFCVQGKALLYDYCASRHVPHRRCGKFVVATSAAQVNTLLAMQAHAVACGVTDLVLLNAHQARTAEPALRCVAALHSPSTGIVDSHALMLALYADLENAGGTIALNSPLALARIERDAIELVALDGTRLIASTVVNAAGVQAPMLALKFDGLMREHIPVAHFAKGSYFSLTSRSPFSRLIYPIPEVAGLGVHLTYVLRASAQILARLTRRCVSAGVRRHASQDQRARRNGAGFLHPGPCRPWCEGLGQSFRYRVAGSDQRVGNSYACGADAGHALKWWCQSTQFPKKING